MATRGKLSDDITDEILADLLEGKYALREYLPTEAELCGIFQVSRPTIREAIRRLEAKGVVKSLHGKGVRIINRTADAFSSSFELMVASNDIPLQTLLETRKIIEVPGVRLAALRATEEDIAALQVVLMKLKDESVTKEEYIECDFEFHFLIAKASGNLILESILRALKPFLKKCIEQTLNIEGRPEMSMHFHEDIFNAIRCKNSERASSFMSTHLEATEMMSLKENE